MSARRRFGSITEMPDGTFRGRYRVREKDYYTPRKPTRRAVQADLTAAEAAILAGTWTPPTPRRRRKSSAAQAGGPLFVEELAEQWVVRLEADGGSPNTIRSYRSRLRAHVLPVVGHKRVRDLTGADMQAILDRMGGLSRRTQESVVRTISAMVKAARKEDQPTVPLTVPRLPGKPERSDRRALTAGELSALVDTAAPRLRAAVALAGWCSLRSGEVSGLRREDVDVAAWTVRVRRAVKRDEKGRPVVGPPKSAAGYRTVSIPPQAREVVAAHLSGSEGGADAPLFPGSWGGFLSDRVLRRAVREAALAAGIEPVTVHELRHTGLTLYGQAGATLADLMARAGHTSAETVMIYQHSSAVRDRELAARMGS